jgi:hypothetical protein
LDVRVEEIRTRLSVERTVHIGCAGEPTRVGLFEFNRSPVPAPIEPLDFAVLTVLFSAMRRRSILRVHGPVSRKLLTNLEEFQEAWALGRPERYTVVPIIADEERPVRIGNSNRLPHPSQCAESALCRSTRRTTADIRAAHKVGRFTDRIERRRDSPTAHDARLTHLR